MTPRATAGPQTTTPAGNGPAGVSEESVMSNHHKPADSCGLGRQDQDHRTPQTLCKSVPATPPMIKEVRGAVSPPQRRSEP